MVYICWASHALQGRKQRAAKVLKLKQNLKNRQSPDYRLELIYMKSESLVIVNQHVTVNDLSNFAHTAHHARRVVSAGNLLKNRELVLPTD